MKINGHVDGPIPIQCCVRQGCPMSIQLYVQYLHPLLVLLNEKLTELRIGWNGRRIGVMAYADDLTIFVTSPRDFPVIRGVLQTFKGASDARLNPQK